VTGFHGLDGSLAHAFVLVQESSPLPLKFSDLLFVCLFHFISLQGMPVQPLLASTGLLLAKETLQLLVCPFGFLVLALLLALPANGGQDTQVLAQLAVAGAGSGGVVLVPFFVGSVH